MRDNISPEEKLLRLIRGPKKHDLSTKEVSGRANEHPFNPSDRVRNSLDSFTHRLRPFLSLKRIIWSVFIVSFVYLLASLIYPAVFLKKIKLPAVPQGKTEAKELKSEEEIKPYEYYSQGLGGRNIFTSPASQQQGQPSSAINSELIKDINLVGIISGDNPQAIIEDKKTQKTYYVSKGQFIGEFQVEEIQEGKIILNNKGQRFELYI